MRCAEFLWIALAVAVVSHGSAAEPCVIEVTEKGTGWPVPLVELRTTSQLRFVTDNAGLIAIDEPELMDREVWFTIFGDGYDVPTDGFQQRGVRLMPQSGKTLKVEVTRKSVAIRLGRLTGSGIFGEAQKVGRELEWKESGVFGCDSVQNAVYRGKMFWAWGDTNLPGYPLGVFDMTSATTAITPLQSFEPPLRLTFDLFRDEKGRPRGVAKMPGVGPTWVWGYTTLPDSSGRPRLVGSYVKIKPGMTIYEQGLCVWNDETSSFERVRMLWEKTASSSKPPPLPDGHPAVSKDANGKEWVYFGNPLPKLRCPATFEGWQDPTSWEVLTPQETLVSGANGERVRPHTGSIAWNSFRQRWVTVFMEANGKPSILGELWYAEASRPTGPWGKAVKVLSHENYTFYNPRLHPEFTPPDSPILLFEGTYTAEFANHPPKTPRYDYNQMLYRLDLDDPALAAAQQP